MLKGNRKLDEGTQETDRVLHVRIPELIEERGWSISEFAKRSGFTYRTAHRMARGDVHLLKLETISRLCRLFDISIDQLIVGTDATD